MINHTYLRGGVNMGNTLSVANIQTSLTREQREAVGLLSIGTFLEYFDLMLYVHMAVLLNELFFPKTDPFTSSLLTAFSFCSTYFLRPFGALIFGYIGDMFGRKPVVSIVQLIGIIVLVFMSYRIYPTKIVKAKLGIFINSSIVSFIIFSCFSFDKLPIVDVLFHLSTILTNTASSSFSSNAFNKHSPALIFLPVVGG